MLNDVYEVLAWGCCPGDLRVAGGAAAPTVAAAATTMVVARFWFF
jgi:hypothetical protein